MEVRYVPFGIANNFGDYIELNENLKKYPKLHDSILYHEYSHTNNPGFTFKDFMLDLRSPSTVSNWELLKFMVQNPRSFIQLLPIYKQGNVIFYDINTSIIWGVTLGIVGTILFFLLR